MRDEKAARKELAEQIAGWHETAALVLGLPELRLSRHEPDDALILAAAVEKLQEQYPIRINPKILAALGIVAAASRVYLPKFQAIGARAKQAQERRAQPPQAPPRPAPAPRTTEPAAATNGAAPPVAPTPGDFILTTVPPDGGKIRFSE